MSNYLDAIIRATRNTWEDLRDWFDVIGLSLMFSRMGKPKPKLLLYFGYSPGDDLLCTAVLRELSIRGRTPLLMVSNHAALFTGNQDVAYVRPVSPRYYMDRSTVAICGRYTRICGGEFKRVHYARLQGNDRSRSPSRHIIAELCAEAGVSGRVTIKPYFTLTEQEKLAAAWAEGRIAVQSSGMSARNPILNKQWCKGRFEAVVNALRGEVEFIQLGSSNDPPLEHVKDLRGATSVRETAAILYNSRLYVGTVGFLMHLARAVECPGVIVFGGREAPWQSGYICNFNLYSDIPCAPCWRWNSCDFDRRCMREIRVEDVVAAIREMMSKPRGPLAVQTVELGNG